MQLMSEMRRGSISGVTYETFDVAQCIRPRRRSRTSETGCREAFENLVEVDRTLHSITSRANNIDQCLAEWGSVPIRDRP